MSISEAIKEHPELVRKYLEPIIPQKIIFMQNSAVFSDGLLLYSKRRSLPNGTFNLESIKQEQDSLRELTIVADEGSYVSSRGLAQVVNENQHAAVRTNRLDDAEIKYSTVQNWYPGNKEGKGGSIL
jgi:Fe-S cluster assembly protein SufB